MLAQSHTPLSLPLYGVEMKKQTTTKLKIIFPRHSCSLDSAHDLDPLRRSIPMRFGTRSKAMTAYRVIGYSVRHASVNLLWTW